MIALCPKDKHLTQAIVDAPLMVGSVEIRNRIALAPMSGVTDLPFRKLALEFGAGFVVTEMVASRELVGNTAESWARLRHAGFKPHIVQLAGREPGLIANAARIAADNGADIIDLNMGCPAKKVIGGLSGSALMREPELALAIIEATVNAVEIPVTVKMRLGWDEASINAPELAEKAEALDVKMITVHGRTRMQFYEGRADWQRIADVRARISIPLIANGDVETQQDVAEILKVTGADGVMVGRGCQGRPWHAGVLAGSRAEPDELEAAQIFANHYAMMMEFYGQGTGVRHARKHVGWYLDRFCAALPGDLRASIMTSDQPDLVIQKVVELMGSGEFRAPTDVKEAA
jgi:tRNA-dihydrouridine synthase B